MIRVIMLQLILLLTVFPMVVLPVESHAESGKKRTGKTRASRALVNFRDQAQAELSKAQSQGGASSLLQSTTVRLNLNPPDDEPERLHLLMGLWLNMYQPHGSIQPVGLEAYSLDTIQPYPVWNGRFFWQPLQLQVLGHPTLGPSASFGLGIAPITVHSPTQYDFGPTYITHIDTQIGIITEWKIPVQSNHWFGSVQTGLGRNDLLQSSDSSLLNMSGSASYLFAEVALRIAIVNPFSVQLSFQWRQPLVEDLTEDFQINPKQEQVLIGIGGEL